MTGKATHINAMKWLQYNSIKQKKILKQSKDVKMYKTPFGQGLKN